MPAACGSVCPAGVDDRQVCPMIEPTCWTSPFIGTRFGKNKWSQSPERTAHRLQQEVPIGYLMVKWDKCHHGNQPKHLKGKNRQTPTWAPKTPSHYHKDKSWTQTLCLDIGKNERNWPDRDLNFDLNKYSVKMGLKNIWLVQLRILFFTSAYPPLTGNEGPYLQGCLDH